jgi:RHS repeat-associated protein
MALMHRKLLCFSAFIFFIAISLGTHAFATDTWSTPAFGPFPQDQSISRDIVLGRWQAIYGPDTPPICAITQPGRFECWKYRWSAGCTQPGYGAFYCSAIATLTCPAGYVPDNSACAPIVPAGSGGCQAVQVGHPVEAASGRVVESALDWSGGPSTRLTLERTYASMSASLGVYPTLRFGSHWLSPFDSHAGYIGNVSSPVVNEQIRIFLPDVTQADFIYSYSPAGWMPSRGTASSYSILSTFPNVVLKLPDGTKNTYDLQGRLLQIEKLGGYKQFLNYSGNLNTNVTDSLGQTLKFEYNSLPGQTTLVKTVTTPDGTVINYSYVDRGIVGSAYSNERTLTEVVYPDVTPATLTDNPRLKYDYGTDLGYRYQLSQITDERGIVKAAWTYDSSGRAVTARERDGPGTMSLSYDDVNNKVSVTNALGRTTVYTFTVLPNGARRLTQVDGVPTTNCLAANTTYAYDANGFRSQQTDAEGRIKTYSNDALGRILSNVDGFGTPQARTMNQTWDPVRPLPTQTIVPGLTTNLSYDSSGNLTQQSQLDTTTTTVPYSTNGQTRTTTFGYTTFATAGAPAIAASGTVLPDVSLTIVNADAQTGPVTGAITGWTNANSVATGIAAVAIATDGPCSITNRCFYGPSGNAVSAAYQDVPIPSANFAEVDGGLRSGTVSWLQDGQIYGYNTAGMSLQYLNAAGQIIGTNLSSFRIAKFWELRSSTSAVPALTRTIRVRMAIKNAAVASIDSISLKLIGNGAATAKPFLAITNPDAMGGVTTGWTVSTPRILATNSAVVPTSPPCNTFECFYSDGLANGPGLTALGNDTMTQDIALPAALNAEIDANKRGLDVRWVDQTYTGSDSNSVQIDFLNTANAIISGASITTPSANSNSIWVDRLQYADVPALARKVRLTFSFNREFPNIYAAGFLTGITAQLRNRNFPAGTLQLLTSVDGPLAGIGDKVVYAYDIKGNLSQVTNEVGLITKITAVDTAGRPTALLDPNSVITNLAYDPRGKLTSITVNPGTAQAVTTIAYDAAQNITKITRPDGSFLSYAWDSVPNITSVTNNTGESITYGYGGAGHITSSTVKSSAAVITKQMTMTYDEIGRLLKSIGAAAQTTSYAYDRTDNLKQTTDPRNNLFGYAYDAVNRLVQTTNEDGAVVNVTRDGQDNVVAYQDPRLITTSYVRNGFGEVIQEVSPDAGTTTYVRDLRGLVTQMTDGRGVVETRTYDNAGRQLTASYGVSDPENVTYAYDSVVSPNKGKGHLTSITDQSGSTSFTYNALGQIITDKRVIAAKTYTTSYLYNAAGLVSQITYPSGRIVIYARNANGQVTGVTTKQNATAAVVNVATGITYAPMSNLLTALTHGNGLTTTAGYDLDYRLTALSLKNGAANVSSLAYAYSDGMNLTGITDNVTPANSVALWYSGPKRLQYASSLWGDTNYYYDIGGNRTYDNNTVSAVTTTKTTYYDTITNHMTNVAVNGTTNRSFAYDGAGNISNDNRPGEAFVFAYNKRNRMASVTKNGLAYASYGYNALEQLTTRSTAAVGGPVGQVAYLYDLDGHLIAEATASTGATTRDYIWAAANDNTPVDLPLAVAEAATLYMVHADHLGRPIRMTDATKATVWQAQYKPFGEPVTLSGTKANNLRFPGQYFQIETGFAYNWHRHYDPTTGRYTQPDPLRFVDGPSVYAYAGSSPFIFVDPDGLAYIPDPNPIVPGGPWTPNPANRPGNFLGPKIPGEGRPQCQWVPAGGDGGPPGSEGYWKTNQPGVKGWQRFNRGGTAITPEEAHPGTPTVPRIFGGILGKLLGALGALVTSSGPAY